VGRTKDTRQARAVGVLGLQIWIIAKGQNGADWLTGMLPLCCPGAVPVLPRTPRAPCTVAVPGVGSDVCDVARAISGFSR